MTLLIFIYGLIIGSFLNVLIYRIPREESIVFPSSHCPKCNTSLKWYNNIPLFSYLSLKGKCRYCGVKISRQYPAIESLNALISSVLVVITVIDLKEMIIPDILVVIILILSVLHKGTNYFIYGQAPEIINSLGGLLIAGGLFLAIVILSGGEDKGTGVLS